MEVREVASLERPSVEDDILEGGFAELSRQGRGPPRAFAASTRESTAAPLVVGVARTPMSRGVRTYEVARLSRGSSPGSMRGHQRWSIWNSSPTT